MVKVTNIAAIAAVLSFPAFAAENNNEPQVGEITVEVADNEPVFENYENNNSIETERVETIKTVYVIGLGIAVTD